MAKRTFSVSTVQHKTGTAAQWTSVNPTLAKGEIGAEIDAGRIKIGDGVTAWVNLPYIGQFSTAPVGHIQQQYVVETGYLSLDGATYSRTTYAALWAWANNVSGLVATSPASYQFGTGDGSTTFTVPNHVGRMWQGNSAIGQKEAGLPDTTGAINGLVGADAIEANMTGTFRYGGLGTVGAYPYNDNVDLIVSSSGAKITIVNFKASWGNSIYGASTTVQGPAIELLPQIKY